MALACTSRSAFWLVHVSRFVLVAHVKVNVTSSVPPAPRRRKPEFVGRKWWENVDGQHLSRDVRARDRLGRCLCCVLVNDILVTPLLVVEEADLGDLLLCHDVNNHIGTVFTTLTFRGVVARFARLARQVFAERAVAHGTRAA